MSIVKILAPYVEDMAKYMDSGRIDPKVVRELKPIYEEYWKTNRHIGVSTMKTSCPGCIYDCIKALHNTYREQANVVDFKGVPDKSQVKTMKEPIKPLKPVKTPETITLNPNEPEKVDWSKKTWSEIKGEAKNRGLKIYGKKKPEIINELNG